MLPIALSAPHLGCWHGEGETVLLPCLVCSLPVINVWWRVAVQLLGPLERDGGFQYRGIKQSPSANIDTEDLNVHFIPARAEACAGICRGGGTLQILREWCAWFSLVLQGLAGSTDRLLVSRCVTAGGIHPTHRHPTPAPTSCTHSRKIITLLSQSLMLKPVLQRWFNPIQFSG